MEAQKVSMATNWTSSPCIMYTSLYREVPSRDLHAAETRCHPYCCDKVHKEYRSWIRVREHAEKMLNSDQACKVAAHRDAFNAVDDTLKKHVIMKTEVIQLSSIYIIFINNLTEDGHPNSEYWSEKLLHWQQKHNFCENISFSKISSHCRVCVCPSISFTATE